MALTGFGIWKTRQNLEAIYVWKVARLLPNRRVVACLSFKMRCTNYNQIEIKTGLKRILERVLPRKNTNKARQNFFLCSYHDFLKFVVIYNFLKTVFTYEILLLVFKFVLNKINLTCHGTKVNMLFFCCVLELAEWNFCFIVTLSLYPVP